MSKPKTRYIDDIEPTLEEMQKFVGGYIEVLHISKELTMVIDEEGKLNDKPINQEATNIAHEHEAIFEMDYIAGDVLILSGNARLS